MLMTGSEAMVKNRGNLIGVRNVEISCNALNFWGFLRGGFKVGTVRGFGNKESLKAFRWGRG